MGGPLFEAGRVPGIMPPAGPARPWLRWSSMRRRTPAGTPRRALEGGLPVLDVARSAVEAAVKAGADYSDARVGTDLTEAITVRNQEMEGIDRAESTGLGVRVLVDGRWGFAATARLDAAEIDHAAATAVQTARAAARLPADPVEL